MKLGPYELFAAIGEGPGGPSYLAELPGHAEPLELRIVSQAKADPARWQALCQHVRLAERLIHPAALAIQAISLDSEPAYVVLDGRHLNLGAWQPSVPLPPAEVLGIANTIADVLAAAHRLGLAHGRLGPCCFLGSGPQAIQLDFTGTELASGDGAVAAVAEPAPAPTDSDAMQHAFAQDIFGFGALLHYLSAGTTPSTLPETADSDATMTPDHDVAAGLARLIRNMLDPTPARRPLLATVQSHMEALLLAAAGSTQATPINVGLSEANAQGATLLQRGPANIAPQTPGAARLGRFRLLDKLGQGNMGLVYRAQDDRDGSIVALKVLRSDWVGDPAAILRLRKEARLLAEVNNPYVTNLLEVNEDHGVHYLVLEYVAGKSLGQVLREGTKLPEQLALTIMSDVARALVDAHERGIVHRDIKPDNILVIESGAEDGGPAAPLDRPRPRIKLADFGLARHAMQSESLSLTADGQLIGTPLYMAPEQTLAQGGVGVRADVYAMGATLFHLLAGRPPFLADNVQGILAMHCGEAPPPLQKFNPQASDAVAQIINKALEKDPEARQANAGELLRDLERLLRGEPTNIAVHPRLPSTDSHKVLSYDWTWDLQSSPSQLWPLVSNTERLNKAAGLSAVQYSVEADAHQVRRLGLFRRAGLTIAWEEHPFEWVEGKRMAILREYSQGVFRWMLSAVELAPLADGGTRLTHRVRIEPNGVFGRVIAAIEVAHKGHRAVDRIYRRMDAALTGKLGRPATVDAFEPPAQLRRGERRQLDHLLDQLGEAGIDPHVVEQLGEFVAQAPAQEVARIRPLELAQRLGVDPDQVLAACLHGSRLGLFMLLWDILCPRCRISSSIEETLRALETHTHCSACNANFDVDFANSVEMIFRVHPQIRAAELGMYCVGGPAHSPHVIAQVRIAPGERFELVLNLPEGDYRFRGAQLPYAVEFRVHPDARARRWELDLAQGPDRDLARTLRAGTQVLVISNPLAHELVVRVERQAAREALTAARVASLPLFRELFPGELLAPGQLMSVATLTLLTTNLCGAEDLYRNHGDAGAVALIHEHFRVLSDFARRESGVLVKTIHNGMLLTFHDTAAAVRVALSLKEKLLLTPALCGLQMSAAVHRGSTIAATLNHQMDYFGQTVDVALRLALCAKADEVLVTQPVASDPQVAALLGARRIEAEVVDGEPWQEHLGETILRLKPVGPGASRALEASAAS